MSVQGALAASRAISAFRVVCINVTVNTPQLTVLELMRLGWMPPCLTKTRRMPLQCLFSGTESSICLLVNSLQILQLEVNLLEHDSPGHTDIRLLAKSGSSLACRQPALQDAGAHILRPRACGRIPDHPARSSGGRPGVPGRRQPPVPPSQVWPLVHAARNARLRRRRVHWCGVTLADGPGAELCMLEWEALCMSWP